MIVVGGSYREECLVPDWRRIFGSGGRAAVALSGFSPGTELHTYAFRGWADDVRHSMAAQGVVAYVTEIEDDIGFSYLHRMSAARMRPLSPRPNAPLAVSGRCVLRFGFVEGDARVAAHALVFDPQSCGPRTGFREGSAAERFAVVANEEEVCGVADEASLTDAVAKVFAADDPEVVVVKRGPHGSLVFGRGVEPVAVPVYRSDRVFKIGSGDVFSAVFAHLWCEAGADARSAADAASRAVSHYVATRDAALPAPTDLVHGGAVSGPFGQVYLAAPFFDLAQRWQVEEALGRLTALGVRVFSPLHDVGSDRPAGELATADLTGLRASASVLALVDGGDPGTLFEVGYARSLDIPVVAFGMRVPTGDLTMLTGTGCVICDDFATALYAAVWAAAA